MANRAERRRMMRQMELRSKIGPQTRMETSAAMSAEEVNRLNREIMAMGNGGHLPSRVVKDEQLRRKIAARDKVVKMMEQGGITVKDLEDAREDGRHEGFAQASETVIKCCYAGIILALHDEFGFGENRCFRAIKAVDEKIIWALNHSELADEVLEKTGLELMLDEPFERVQKRDKPGKA